MLRATAIMKTDIRASTAHFRSLAPADVETLLEEHRAFVARLASGRGGRIVKAEGDGYWLCFPSVTAAALTAMQLQEELRLAQPGRGEGRVAMRIVISLGDVIEQPGALVGDAVVLAARVEAVTPPDEIYLSETAWRAAAKAEVRATLVDAFLFKGFPEPVPVYRIEQTHRVRVVADQYIVVIDLHGFGPIDGETSLPVLEKTLDHLLRLVEGACHAFSGTHRSNSGDSYLLTFADAGAAVSACESLATGWEAFRRGEGVGSSLNLALHKGALFAFRGYLIGQDINATYRIEKATAVVARGGSAVFVTGRVHADLADAWRARLERVEVAVGSVVTAPMPIYRLVPG